MGNSGDIILNSPRCIKGLIASATLLQKIVAKLDKEMESLEVKRIELAQSIV